jgi:hypothetical protein
MKKIYPLEGIIEPKELLNPYIAAGIAGRVATNVETNSHAAKILDKIIAKVALRSLVGLSVDYPQDDSILWHGTGRYKYKNGKIVDILDSIAYTGKILPSTDKFDLLRQMKSISLAKSRMYARAYADMFGDGEREKERYGSSLFWACAFLGSIAIEASKETRVWRPSGYNRMMGHLATADALEWYKKITRIPNPSVIGAYGSGSDIHQNYPVLFAVNDVDRVKTSRAVSLHEVRTESAIDISSSVLHVEVPRTRINETKSILGGLAIKAIEDGEIKASEYSFSQHMHAVL